MAMVLSIYTQHFFLTKLLSAKQVEKGWTKKVLLAKVHFLEKSVAKSTAKPLG
jgi:hypothetical protein